MWKLVDVRFGTDGVYNPQALTKILITDELHRRRSVTAEEKTLKAMIDKPIPPAAANRGRRNADPNSPEEILLNEGV